MEKIDFRIHANFMGKEVILAPNNGQKRQDLKQAIDELDELRELSEWYAKEQERIDDKDLSEDDRGEAYAELDAEFEERAEKFKDGLKDHRKRVCEIMIDKWKDGKPEDHFYDDDHFDDFALNRMLRFFLNPNGLNPEPSTG